MDEISILQEEISRINLANKKLDRELRITNSFLEKMRRSVEAKDAMSDALTMAHSKQRLYMDLLLGNCPNIIILLDDMGRFALCTRAFTDAINAPNFDYIMGRTYGDILSACLSEAIAEKLHDSIRCVMETKNTVLLNEWIDFCQTGNSRNYSIEFTIVEGPMAEKAGITAGVLAVFTDLTDFMREKDRAEAANQAKSGFLATMSHEIRTPMNAILGMTEIISRQGSDSQQQKYLDDIKKSAHSLLAIINDILDFSKIEAGKLDILNGGYRLRELLDNLSAMFEPLFGGKGLTFRRFISEDVPTAVYGDENRLRQVLTNILSNALKYTSKGFAEFRITMTAENALLFEIQDSGIGIRDEDVFRLFTPFEQLDLQRNRNITGTGLGLAITRKLCELMDGRLWLESEYGIGSTFFVELPCIIAGTDLQAQTETDDIEFSAASARVLVVDDIDINLSVAEAMLGVFDISPTSALTGAAAVEYAAQNEYDVIFMDQMMPEMDGIEATALIRDLGGYCENVPIIALTANVVNNAEAMLLVNGFNDFLGKPLELKKLSACLIKWLPKDKVAVKD